MARRKKQPAAEGPRVHHPRSCACKGFGVIPAGQVVEKGVVYTKVSTRCPGMPVKPVEADAQQRAAGEAREA